MTIIEDRLRALADEFDFGDASVADGVLDRIASRSPSATPVAHREWSWHQVAAIVVVVIAAAVLAVPSSRHAVADWLGFGGVQIERVPDLSVPATASPVEPATASPIEPTVGPTIEQGVVEVDGTEVLVSEIPGMLEQPLLSKTVGDGTDVIQVEINGSPGVWIVGAPHEVAYRADDGSFVFERFAGDTLLWQDGEVIRRVEGFETLEAALRFAEDFGT